MCANGLNKEPRIFRVQLRHWAGDLAAEICERLEEDLAEHHRRATLLTVFYHYNQNGSIVSQTRSLTLNSYKPEKIASQCVDVITKATQCPVIFMGVSASKFVPSKESSSFLKFFKTVKSNDKDSDKVDSEIDKLNNAHLSRDGRNCRSNVEASDEKKKTVTRIISKENEVIKTEEKKSERGKEVATTTVEDSPVATTVDKASMKGSKGIVNASLNKCTADSPTSRKVSKLIQVCNDKSSNKRMSDVAINNNDFQDSFFMSIYKTKKETRSDGDTAEESESGKEMDDEKDAYSENSSDYDANLYIREKAREKPSTSRACPSDNNSTEESREETSVRDSSVRLRDIFPNLDDIDPDILSSLPAELQEEAKAYMNSRSKKQETIKSARVQSKSPIKSMRGKSGKSKVTNKTGKRRNPLYNFLIKTDSSEHDVPLERCAECNQMIPITKFSEHVDFHFAQNLCQEINRPTSSESGVKRKLEDAETAVTSVKRQMNANSATDIPV